MRFLEINQTREWCDEHEVAITERGRPEDDPALAHQHREVFAPSGRTGKESEVAADCINFCGSFKECLLWVVLWGVWPSSEDWPRYYRARGDMDELRSLDGTPGHLFVADDKALLTDFLTQILENGWEAYLLPLHSNDRVRMRIFISHDGWLEKQSRDSLQHP